MEHLLKVSLRAFSPKALLNLKRVLFLRLRIQKLDALQQLYIRIGS